MSTDKRSTILDNIRTTFALITTAGGYNFTVGYQDIGVKDIQGIPEDKFPALMVAGADEDRSNATNAGFTSAMDISIVGYVRSSNVHDPRVAEQDLSKLIADLTKALYVDPTRGGNCKYTEVGKILTDKGYAAPYAVFEMVVSVEYRATFAAP